jgi:hypothetical protein
MPVAAHGRTGLWPRQWTRFAAGQRVMTRDAITPVC